MSVWQEKEDEVSRISTATLNDVVFTIDCPSLPVDHAAALTSALCATVPWLAELPGAGVHPIHVAGSQNGWQRPDARSGEPLLLSKRTKLRIRAPIVQTPALIEALSQTTHTLGDHQLTITSGRPASLQTSATLFARYTLFDATPVSEEEFLQHTVKDCESLGFHPTKLLCGRCNTVSTPTGPLQARSILIADVPPEYSIRLQEQGLGSHRLMGCGMLIPHKDTGAV